MKRFLLFTGCLLLISSGYSQRIEKRPPADTSMYNYLKTLAAYTDSVRQLQLLAPAIGPDAYRERMKLLIEHRSAAMKAAVASRKKIIIYNQPDEQHSK